ncbi:MAG: bifunctional 5,10-methylenetetrahydrofolate dehydrogenase/5,10-methenyltetrahydrofolate cyclohydrolase [Anaplasmataceae bacterium]|nr:bifunctional 5,10-methylenetetrahydrofolate dehydrogenase/5,10-methenyltetrahydrofolate cyclohydrolase [Anaplasmataceae bacterium]
MTFLIEGKKISNIISSNLELRIGELKKKYNIKPKLVVIIIGNNPASEVYVRNKQKKAEQIGIISEIVKLSIEITEDDLIKEIDKLNNDDKVSGILVQLPLPSHISEYNIVNQINKNKDVDCFNYSNIGKFFCDPSQCVFHPCTPAGCMHLLENTRKHFNIQGKKNAVIIGRSNIVGKPLFHLLLSNNYSVTMVHSKTKNIEEIVSQADVVMIAVGKLKLVKQNWIKKDAIVIDVGINRGEDGKLAGDADFDDIKDKALAITPVPGGVGPMTIIFLMINTINANLMQNNLPTIKVNSENEII